MSSVVGYVKQVEGEFFAKSDRGMRPLKPGDPIYRGEVVFSPGKSLDNTLVVESGGREMAFHGKTEILMDGRFLAEGLGNEEETDGEKLDGILKDYGDIPLDETAIGEEDVAPKTHEGEGDRFLEGGAMANVESSLRAVESHSYTLDHELDPFHGAGNGGFTPVASQSAEPVWQSRPEPVGAAAVARPESSAVEAPAVPVSPALIGEISLSPLQESVVEGEGASYVLRLTQAPTSDLVVHIRVEHGETDAGDIEAGIVDVVVPAGATEARFTLPTIDSAPYENDETFHLSIAQTEGGGFAELNVTSGAVETTIVDDAPVLRVEDADQTTEGAQARFVVSLPSRRGQCDFRIHHRVRIGRRWSRFRSRDGNGENPGGEHLRRDQGAGTRRRLP